jgi:riboflavin kinase/FMN adenylyltransferase
MALRETAVAVGNFDGIHLGHLHLLETLREEAFKRHLKPLAVTFEPHPAVVLKREKDFCLLSTAEEKKEILENQLGIKCEILPFTEGFSQMSPEEFVENILLERFKAKLIVVGYDWRFGRGAKGDIETVKEICKKRNCEVLKVKPYTAGGKIVSSSLIRALLREARLKEASLFLGHPYWIRRRVVKGRGLGSKLGVPTLNFKGVENLCLPNGVYVVCIDGHPGVANLGCAPTFGGKERTLEVHILRDFFDVSTYPRIVFKRYLRPERAFKSAEELLKRIKEDIKHARETFLED